MADDLYKYYIGLISGTSLDGVDVAIIDSNDKVIATNYLPYTKKIINTIKSINKLQSIQLKDLSYLDRQIAKLFTICVKQIIKKK